MKNIVENILVLVVAVAFAFILLCGWKMLQDNECNEEQRKEIKFVEIPVENRYVLTYKDGTKSTVCANSYIWDDGKIRFIINDTIVVKEISSSCVKTVEMK